MTRSIKHRLLRAIADDGPIGDSLELQPAAGTDQHNLIHVLYSLNRVGHIRFRLRWRGRKQLVTRIEITASGRAELERLEAGR